ncbi:hypothetical protein [Kineosporia succinea]|uniref:Uncharacterized protein n=1 Tax=Kineosporia succinea TaxID=84632 RepID=A0ABT9NVZ2_9ACTN|nr:hypothetical protein [Kineosporia succinea]MDP9824447.1 hypothetical protein [Kineosporia succinea]
MSADTMSKEPERWHLIHEGHEHTVEISTKATAWMLHWKADGSTVAQKKTSENTVVLDGKEHGAIRLKLPSISGPARRVTLYASPEPKGATGQAHLGVGGTDFVPEEGSRAAKREAWIRDHPHQYATRRTLTALAGVLVPIGLLWLLRQITWRPDVNLPSVNLPSVDLPRIPWPDIDLPSIPWPDVNLPSVNLPDLPGWVQYVWPVLLAFGVAQAELRRRKQQDLKRSEASRTASGATSKESNGEQPGRSKTGEARPDENQTTTRDTDDEKPVQACKVTPVTAKPGHS